MSDIAITAANVARGSGASTNLQYNAGETVTAGMIVYLKTTDNKWYKAQSDGTSEEAGSGTLLGVALHGSLANQPLAVQTGGNITIGGTLAVGTVYYLSTTAGGIAPLADLSSTNKVTILGFGATASVMTLMLLNTGVAVP